MKVDRTDHSSPGTLSYELAYVVYTADDYNKITTWMKENKVDYILISSVSNYRDRTGYDSRGRFVFKVTSRQDWFALRWL